MKRRTFLQSASLASLALASTVSAASTPSRPRPLKILMLGGTNYVGPHLVHTALDRGHEVTLFNRGLTNPRLFPQLEKLRGDRKRGPEALKPLKGRRFDIVLDTWQQWPRSVEESVAALADATDVYAYVSSIAAYPRYAKVGLTEDDPRAAPAERDPTRTDFGYRLNKALGEAAVERRFDERGLIVRAHAIMGFDYSGRYSNNGAYWVLRMKTPGPVLVPDDNTALVQYTDIDDFCRFIVTRAERRAGGTYNAVTPPMKFIDYVRACRKVADAGVSFEHVAPQFVIDHGGAPFESVPKWIPIDEREPGFYQVSSAKAERAGLQFRPLENTIRAVLRTYEDQPAGWFEGWRAGTNRLSAETEDFILKAKRAAGLYG